MMTLEEMKRKRAEMGLSYEELSSRSGVPLPTIQKIFSGKTKSPRYTTLAALERVLGDRDRGERMNDSYHDGRTGRGTDSEEQKPLSNGMVREAAALYSDGTIREAARPYMTKRQGEYTVDDWFNLPEDAHMELIDGVLYDLSEPTTIHQLIAGQLYAMFLNCITEHGMDCIPFIAPCGVQLDYDKWTMVEPDVFIICDRDRILRSHVPGAPDLVVEVLSKSTRMKDMTRKLQKYQNAGVREYWMIDPDKRKVIVYTFFGEAAPDVSLYGFDSKIPVGISDGKCLIDFQKIHQYVQFIYDKPE